MLLNDGNGERVEAYRLLAGLFSHPPDAEEIDAVREELELNSRDTEFSIFDDFANLFAIPGGKLPPLESLNNPMGGDTLADRLTVIYAEAGLTHDEEYELVPDHLSLEFLFMSYLVDTEDLVRQESFLEEHIISWVPEYCDRVLHEAGTDYYRELAAMTKSFVEQEYEGFQ